jgi:sulfur carrier protein ThiS
MKTIQAQVSPDLLQHAPYFFNNSLKDIIIELFQNARRAGATVVKVAVEPSHGGARISVHDNGRGVEDFSALLHLGKSNWDEGTKRREHPAGMGIYSLCASGVSIASGTERVSLNSIHFSGASPATIETIEEPVEGTLFTFERKETGAHVAEVVKEVGVYAGVAVYLNGELVPAEDFLSKAVFTREVNGVVIGVMLGKEVHYQWNFYGRRIRCATPSLHRAVPGKYDAESLSVCIDVRHTGSLNLKLPDRSEIVKDNQYQEVIAEAERTLYLYLATLPQHCAGYEAYKRAAELGVGLKEAVPFVSAYYPSSDQEDSAYSTDIVDHRARRPEVVTPDRIVVVEYNDDPVKGAGFSFCVNRQYFPESCPLPAEIEAMVMVPREDIQHYMGYSWTANLPAISGMKVEVNNESLTALNANLTVVDAIEMSFQLTVQGQTRDVVWKVPFGCSFDPDSDDLCNLAIIQSSPWAAGVPTPFDLTDAAAFLSFRYSDDVNDDASELQLERFIDECSLSYLKVLGGDLAVAELLTRRALDWEMKQALMRANVSEVRLKLLDRSNQEWSIQLVV